MLADSEATAAVHKQQHGNKKINKIAIKVNNNLSVTLVRVSTGARPAETPLQQGFNDRLLYFHTSIASLMKL